MFDLIAGTDEPDSDRACHYACAHALNGNQHTRPTHATRPHVTRPHHTRPTHGTRAPQPTDAPQPT